MKPITRRPRTGRYGVLFAHAHQGHVVERTLTPADTWRPLRTVLEAAHYGTTARLAQPGIEFVVVRHDGQTWRDLRGRAI